MKIYVKKCGKCKTTFFGHENRKCPKGCRDWVTHIDTFDDEIVRKYVEGQEK